MPLVKTHKIMKKSLPPVIGIIGGGQLARMMIQEGQKLGVPLRLIAKDHSEPAAQVLNQSFFFKGDPESYKDLRAFLKTVNLVTFESEFISVALLEQAAKELPVQFFPGLQIMAQLQDRLFQKRLLVENKIATSPFLFSENEVDHFEFFKKYKKVVYKKRIGGYDGYGTFIFDSIKDIKRFLTKNNLQDFIVEVFIPFTRELACTFVRASSIKSVANYPLVETRQAHHRCDFVFGPIAHPGTKKLFKQIKKMLNAVDYVGCITFELFEVKGQLLVNEVAPRVHNSAHYTQNACNKNQFQAHLQAGLGLPLSHLKMSNRYFAMTNLLGASIDVLKHQHLLTGILHWYGKIESRAGRKMGHINYLSDNSKILSLALSERKKFLGQK